jgi:hypothetical protein
MADGRGYVLAMTTQHATEAPARATTLGFVGIVGVAAFAAAFAAMHVIQSDLNPIQNFGSDYAFGRGGWLMRLGFIAAGIGTLSLALGLRRSVAAVKRRGLGVVLLGLAGVGFIGSGLFNADPPLADGTTGYTTEGSLHDLTGILLFISVIVAGFVLARVFARDPQWQAAVSTTRIFAWLALAGLVATITSSEMSDPGTGITGLVQRIFVATILGWLVSLGWRLRRGSEG